MPAPQHAPSPRDLSSIRPEEGPSLEPDAKREFVRGLFDRIAPHYDAANVVISLGQTSLWRWRALGRLPLGQGSRVLDVGCGTGWVVQHLRRRYPGIEVEGMDLSTEMLREARARDPEGSYFEGDVTAIPRPDAHYDGITTVFTLRNFPDLEAATREMLRVLRPGGFLLALDTFPPQGAPGPWQKLHRLWLRRVVPALVAPFGDPAPYRYMAESIFRHVSVPEYEAMLRRLGAREVSIRHYSFGTATRVFAQR